MRFAKRLLTVAGAVAIAGMLSVALAPRAVHAVVSTLVTVTNTVTANVTNTTDTNGNPVLAVQNDAPRTAFDKTVSCTFSGSLCQTPLTGFFAVPSGEIAVIESISGGCQMDAGSQLGMVNITLSSGEQYFAPLGTAVPFTGLAFQTFGGDIKRYAFYSSSNPNLLFDIYASQSQSSFLDACTISFAGYLIHQ